MSTSRKSLISNICNNNHPYFLNKSNVVAIGIGNKFSNGINTNETCLNVFVEKKIPLDQLSTANTIPKTYLGVKTDVIETGSFQTHALTTLVRPMLFGYSIGLANLKSAGTAGCYVYDNLGYYILSNNHVLANENLAQINTPIVQPGAIDGGRFPKNLIANLTKFIPINFTTATSTPANYVDCAIAKVSSTSLISNSIALIGDIKGISDAIINSPVRKSGRSTGLTSGSILATNVTANIGYSNGKTALFKNQILTTSMSSPGDSGSLLVDANNNAIGLLFGGSSSATIYNPISQVLNVLGVKLVLS